MLPQNNEKHPPPRLTHTHTHTNTHTCMHARTYARVRAHMHTPENDNERVIAMISGGLGVD